MTYYLTENFSSGLDTRKHELTAPAGTLRDLTNCHISPGGEIIKRPSFAVAFDVAGTLFNSLMRVDDNLYVVSPDVRADETYGDLTLKHITITDFGDVDTEFGLVSWDVFDRKAYFVCRMLNGDFQHYYQDTDEGVTASIVPGGQGAYVRTYQSKMYSCSGKFIYFSAVGDATDWAGTGAGNINTGLNDAEATQLTGMEVYYDRLAVFGNRAVQIWNMDADPANNIQEQTVRAIGSAGRATPRQYGPGDVLFLAPSGIRSLKARDSSNSASVNDVGSPIDEIIREKVRSNPNDVLNNARTMLEDLTGRFWMMFEDEIFVLSLFPGPGVSAWSRYTPLAETGLFVPTEVVDCAGYACVRSATDIYILGGEDRGTYDTTQATFQMPYLSFDTPATWKQFMGFDAAIDGVWTAEVSYDPDNVVWETIGTFDRSTYNHQRMAFRGFSPNASLRMSTTSALAARVANVAIHYNLSKDD